MIQSEIKKSFGLFLKGHEGKLHFAAHSHHFWPDVSREGHLQYWDDSALMSDQKWNKIFSEVIPESQNHIARILNVPDAQQIVFAPNTHELNSRLLSLFLGKKNLRILTTSHEFHSWNRQVTRLEEMPEVFVKRAEIEEIKTELKNGYDIFFISQVFFDSGKALSSEFLLELKNLCPKETIMVIDGYHGFGAIPFDFSPFADRVFYLAGGYKYAQAGEGACFMIVPQGQWRPAYTGWFAEYEELSATKSHKVSYAPNGMSFMGATQDMSGLYRLNSVWNHWNKLEVDTKKLHEYVQTLQKAFINALPSRWEAKYHLKRLFDLDLNDHGHFLTFEAPDAKSAKGLEDSLRSNNIIVDSRGSRIRFGFGLYQDLEDVKALTHCLEKLAN